MNDLRTTLRTGAIGPILRTFAAGISAPTLRDVGGTLAVVKEDTFGSSPAVEAATFELSGIFKGIVRIPTTVVRYDDTTGAALGVVEYLPTAINGIPRDVLMSDLRGLAAFDIMIGNVDRHPANVMYTGTKLHAIDHGLAFEGDGTASFALSRVQGTLVPQYIRNHASDALRQSRRVRDILDSAIGTRRAEMTLERVEYVSTLHTFPRYTGARW